MNARKVKTILYWLTTILGPASFCIGGYFNLTGAEQPVSQMQHLGFPIWFTTIIGFWKLAGAIVCVLPGLALLKEWAYAGFFFNLTGAAAVHYFAGDPWFSDGPAMIFPPLMFLVIVMASWALRPSSRRLPGTDIFGLAADKT